MATYRSIAFILYVFLCFSCSSDSEKVYDERAVKSLDKLSETIGKLNSVSYTLNTTVISINAEKEVEQSSNEHDVYMRGPDKIHLYSKGTKGRKGYWYDGKNFSYFSYDNNAYDIVDVPDKIIDAIDFIHHKYGIDFPAADFFYPTLTDDVLNGFDKLLYWGDSLIDDKQLTEIEALNRDDRLLVWIDKKKNLPYKVIWSQNKQGQKLQYEAVFSNWKSNPDLPDMLFEFEPPADSRKVALVEVKAEN